MRSPKGYQERKYRLMIVDFAMFDSDARPVESDLLILEYAQARLGLHAAVCSLLLENRLAHENVLSPTLDSYSILETKGVLGPHRVMLVGMPSLAHSGYDALQRCCLGPDRTRSPVCMIQEKRLFVRFRNKKATACRRGTIPGIACRRRFVDVPLAIRRGTARPHSFARSKPQRGDLCWAMGTVISDGRPRMR